MFQDEHGGNLTAVQDDNGQREKGFYAFRPGTGQCACIKRARCSPLSESAKRKAADAQHQYREARNCWSPCAPDERTNPGRDGRERGACGQRGRRFPPESHGEPGCGSAKLNLFGRANWIGVAPIAAGAIEERPGPAEARHRYRGEPTGVRFPKSMSIVAEQPPRWSRPGQHFPKI